MCCSRHCVCLLLVAAIPIVSPDAAVIVAVVVAVDVAFAAAVSSTTLGMEGVVAGEMTVTRMTTTTIAIAIATKEEKATT